MILPRYLSVETKRVRYTKDTCEASEVNEIKDDKMSITRSISVAQTDNRVLKGNYYFDYCFY